MTRRNSSLFGLVVALSAITVTLQAHIKKNTQIDQEGLIDVTRDGMANFIEDGMVDLTLEGMEDFNQKGIANVTQEGMLDVERIVGGSQANSAKWEVFVLTKKDDTGGNQYYGCGGSIISDLWIMSAAHCFTSSKIGGGRTKAAERITLTTGYTMVYPANIANNVNDNEYNTAEIQGPNYVFLHRNYRLGGGFNNNDIALIKLKKRLQFTGTTAEPIALARPYDFYPGKLLRASGWGDTSFGGSSSNSLLYVSGLILRSRDECEIAYGTDYTDNMICHRTQKINVCDGDSGGAVVTGRGPSSNGPPYVQIGIISFQRALYNCATTGYFPAIFTDVAKYRSWIIDEIIGKECDKIVSSLVDTDTRCKQAALLGLCNCPNLRPIQANYQQYCNIQNWPEKCKRSCQICGYPTY